MVLRFFFFFLRFHSDSLKLNMLFPLLLCNAKVKGRSVLADFQIDFNQHSLYCRKWKPYHTNLVPTQSTKAWLIKWAAPFINAALWEKRVFIASLLYRICTFLRWSCTIWRIEVHNVIMKYRKYSAELILQYYLFYLFISPTLYLAGKCMQVKNSAGENVAPNIVYRFVLVRNITLEQIYYTIPSEHGDQFYYTFLCLNL